MEGSWILYLLGFWVSFQALANGCLEEERIGLLDLKAIFNHPNGTSLTSWNSERTDCCSWERVKCEPTTRRVIELSLNGIRKFEWGEWYLNASLFLPFQELETLDLSFNLVEGWLQNGDLNTLSMLEVLDLCYNRLKGNIPSSIGDMISLKALSLKGNELNGSLPIEGLCKLKNLQELDLSSNGLEGDLPPCLENLTSLRLLDLSRNQFKGIIPSHLLSSLNSLEYISLSYNKFEGTLSFSSLANNSKLEVFELRNYNTHLVVNTEYPPWVPAFQLKVLHLSNCTLNKPSGAIPSFLRYQHDLRDVDLAHNGMKGRVPTWLLENNTKLEFLSLMNNSLIGPLHLPPHPVNTHIVLFDISNNHIDGPIPSNVGIALYNLLYLNMSKNILEGIIPPSLGGMRNLYSLDLSNNNLIGELPRHLFMGCTELRFLKLSNNRLHGHMLPQNSNLTNLLLLFLDDNHFIGDIPKGLLNSSLLDLLDVSNNFISGELPEWMGNLSSLSSLILSNNSIKGHIPTSFCKLNWLNYLDVSRNGFYGFIPPCLNFLSLRHLHVQHNGFAGPIPEVFSRSKSLVTLDMRDNKLSGKIPASLGLISTLRVVLLKGNHLEGSIPSQLCRLNKLRIMDLSNNNLSGAIPSCLSNIPFHSEGFDDAFSITSYGWTEFTTLRTYSYGNQNHLGVFSYIFIDFHYSNEEQEVEFVTKSRSESYKGNILYFMSGVDLSQNKLNGSIPAEIGDLRGIHTLNLSHNCFSGSIPVSLSNLKQVESLDLSYNRLNGTIPPQLIGLTSLSVFSVAHNNLSGRTPDMQKPQFSTFGATSYEGNLLCGPPLKNTCTKDEVELPPLESDIKDEKGDFSFYIAFAVSYIMGLLGFVALIYFNSYCREALSGFLDSIISYLH